MTIRHQIEKGVAKYSSTVKTTSLSYGLNESRVNGFFREVNKLIKPDDLEDTYNDAQEVLMLMNYTIARLMFELMQPCTKLIHLCNWQGDAVPCERLFEVSTSADGFCCSFNYAAPVEDMDLWVQRSTLQNI